MKSRMLGFALIVGATLAAAPALAVAPGAGLVHDPALTPAGRARPRHDEETL